MNAEQKRAAAVTEEEFQKERRSGLGGSDAAAVCGVDPWKDPLQVYEQKLGIAPPEGPSSIDLKRGRWSESWAVDEFVEHTGFDVLRSPPLMRHKAEDWMMVHLDGVVLEEGTATKIGRPLEVKCPRLHNFYAVKQAGASDAMICQLQHGMAVQGPVVDRGWFVLFHGDVGHVQFPMQRDDAVIERIMESERMFWTEYVLKETPPPQSFGIDTAEYLDLPEGIGAEVVQMKGDEWARKAQRLAEARTLKLEAAALYGEKEGDNYSGVLGEIVSVMRKLSVDAAEGAGIKVYYRQHQGARYFDEKMLRSTAPLDPCLVQAALAAVLGKTTFRKALAALQSCRLDLSAFEKRRNSYRAARVYYEKD